MRQLNTLERDRFGHRDEYIRGLPARYLPRFLNVTSKVMARQAISLLIGLIPGA
jgi:hypothetical protein